MTITATAPTSAPAAAIVAALAAALRTALARAKARHDYRRMLELGDEHLRDVGITRGDIRAAMTAR